MNLSPFFSELREGGQTGGRGGRCVDLCGRSFLGFPQ